MRFTFTPLYPIISLLSLHLLFLQLVSPPVFFFHSFNVIFPRTLLPGDSRGGASPVQLRPREGREGREAGHTFSLTSDLTSSISSAVSASTLVGEAMDSSAYYSGEEGEPPDETTSFLAKRSGRSRMGLNLTHIEPDIQFADTD